MKSILSLSLLVGGALAGVIKLERKWGWQCPAGTCEFTISVNGWPVYENPTDAHQLAYGGSSPGSPVEFCISPAGQITDEDGICGITQVMPGDGETTQFQCDAGMTSVFTIDCNGYIEYEGSPNFYACLASASIGYNIYATAPEAYQCASGTPDEIQLVASGCYSSDCQSEWSSWTSWSGWNGWSKAE